MMQLAWIALGSALGGVLRYALDQLAMQIGWAVFPVSTFVVNLSGSLLIGYLAGVWASGGAAGPHPHKWHFWMTGVCGGYTTYSTFNWQVLELIQGGQAQLAGAYAAASVGGGLIAVWVGLSWSIGRRNEKTKQA